MILLTDRINKINITHRQKEQIWFYSQTEGTYSILLTDRRNTFDFTHRQNKQTWFYSQIEERNLILLTDIGNTLDFTHRHKELILLTGRRNIVNFYSQKEGKNHNFTYKQKKQTWFYSQTEGTS